VIRRDGGVYVAVPDATTLTDRIYRKLSQMQADTSSVRFTGELEKTLAWYFGLPHIATRVLFSSMSFLNRKILAPYERNAVRRFFEIALLVLYAGTRLTDRLFSTRTSIYGWHSISARLARKSPALTHKRLYPLRPGTSIASTRGRTPCNGWRLFKFYRVRIAPP